jgi:O-succinylbenzoic acid--CoA ligase
MECPISENCKLSPDHFALISQERSWTYRECDAIVHNLRIFLENLGVRENQRVAFIAKPSVKTICLFFALFRLRAIACPLSFRIPNAQPFIEQLGAHHFLEPESLPLEPRFEPGSSSIDLDQLATFLFTSGSSSTPKIACHSFGNHYYNAMGAIPPLQLEPTSRWHLSLPLFHVSGIAVLFRCFLRGAAVILDTDDQATHVSLVPTQLYRMLREPIQKHSLRCVLVGGAPIPPTLLDEAKAAGLPVIATYGMTEMSSIITLSDGKPLPFRTMKIEKDQEIWVGGETLFKGYYVGSTVVKADVDGWFPTKDLGRWTEDGQLEVIGRKDRQFISGGENIQPEEIERALCSLPGIRQATVLPIEDAEFGERPVAFIDGEATVETLREALSSRLPRFMHPVHVFPYPPEAGLKPNLSALKQHLAKLGSVFKRF